MGKILGQAPTPSQPLPPGLQAAPIASSQQQQASQLTWGELVVKFPDAQPPAVIALPDRPAASPEVRHQPQAAASSNQALPILPPTGMEAPNSLSWLL